MNGYFSSFHKSHDMSLLSRLLEKLNLNEEPKPPKVDQPESPSGPMTISIDASQHIVEAVTLFRNHHAQVVRTFHDLKLKVRCLSPSEKASVVQRILNR